MYYKVLGKKLYRLRLEKTDCITAGRRITNAQILFTSLLMY